MIGIELGVGLWRTSMSDELGKLPVAQVAGFYRRLADQVDRNKGKLEVSLAALLMRQWLANRNPTEVFHFDAPTHLQEHPSVVEVLRYHRRVYLTQERAKFTGGSESWAGIVPRLQGRPPHAKWDGTGEKKMEYQSLVELPLRYQLTGSDADRDLLYGLHGFQLKSNVAVAVQGSPGSARLRLTFTGFQARVLDRYDWDYREHLTVPNPDFGSKVAGAVAPTSKTVVVYHSNAKRVEDAGLAAPYDLETNGWGITDSTIAGPGEVDPTRSL
jgi:hypothetical protein